MTTPIGSGDDVASAVVVQSDGKLVAAGKSFNGTNYDFALVRYNTNGSLDTSFGGTGKVTTSFGSGDDAAAALVLQPDGKLVAAGRWFNGSNFDFALARYNTNGSLDSTFGTGGRVKTAVGSADDEAFALVRQGDGKLVAAGYMMSGGCDAHRDFALVRYNTNGSLDGTFGSGGKVTTAVVSLDDAAEALVVQSDNKIVAAGYADASAGVGDFALVRYNTNGSLDTTFGGGTGKVTTPVGSYDDAAFGLVVQPADGKLVAAGYAANIDGVGDFALVRYNTNGTLDSTFGTGGKVITPVGSDDDVALALVRQSSDGKFVAAGWSDPGTGFLDFALVRYNTNGSLDTTFGPAHTGKVTTSIGSYEDVAGALVRQGDGKLVAAGYSDNASAAGDFALVRYLAP